MITIHFLVLTACLAASVCFGFFAARVWQPEEGGGPEEEEATKGREKRSVKDGRGWAVGSPVSGYGEIRRDGPEAEIVIQPAEDRLYAPVEGKIMKLYPMGNAFRFRTEFGAELYIRVGDVKDDMFGRYYRPRVVQNEIVYKGKLLLEFDRQGLAAEGASAEVSVCVEHYVYGNEVIATAEGQIRAGDEILWMQDLSEQAEGYLGQPVHP
ncbi:MAG: PTS glucose transporter subunit IIA [Acetatifactor sp.]|nr:PTS glucose transporter subunit IIA [Acetatifactor sp.]MDE7046006.1 PTS glucose transporter subunit IIA [Acetatifactor sp.]